MPVRVGVIAAGGVGVRFGHFDLQKCLWPIESKPLMEYMIDAFMASGVKIIFILTEFLPEQVNNYLASRIHRKGACVLASVPGSKEGPTASICRLRGFVNEDFLFAAGNVITPTTTIQSLVRRAEQLPLATAVMSASRQLEIAPTHVAVAATTDRKFVREASVFEGDRQKKGISLISTDIWYFRPGCFQYMEMVESGRPFGEFVEFALRAGEKIGIAETRNPWFCLHTEEDLRKWPKSTMREHLRKRNKKGIKSE